ncbi:MAG: sulfotransferase family protein [Actinomycetota bacterium]
MGTGSGGSAHAATSNVKRIQCWSGPRNVSTALMYSWRQRADTTVYDEPFYAHYLNRTAREHPMFDEVVTAQSIDPWEVIGEVILGPVDTPVFFMKQMAHHLQGVPRGWLHKTENILLTRDPRDMLRSLSVQLPDCGLADTGLTEQIELLDAILADGGSPIVIDSRQLLEDPAGVLARVCNRLDLDFDDAMLSWPPGPKPEDGVWAPAWYASVHGSTGFSPYRPSSHPTPDRLGPVLDEAVPLYDRLLTFAI